MCDFEEFLFDCNHSVTRLKSYCHGARNDRQHRCYGVKVLRNVWPQFRLCDDCHAIWLQRQEQEQQEQQQ